MSPIQVIDESVSSPHRTVPIRPQDHESLAQVLAAVRKHFINKAEWRLFIREGSLTLQRKKDLRHVIKFFIDVGGVLSTRLFPDAPRRVDLTRDPVLIGLELTHFDPYLRDATRDRLVRDFGWQYLDTRLPSPDPSKIWIQPQSGHLYDLVILPEGTCPVELEVDASEYEEALRLIRKVAAEPEAAPDPEEIPATE